MIKFIFVLIKIIKSKKQSFPEFSIVENQVTKDILILKNL